MAGSLALLQVLALVLLCLQVIFFLLELITVSKYIAFLARVSRSILARFSFDFLYLKV
jgi:hypothetical protein